jgi:hypothetical protein
VTYATVADVAVRLGRPIVDSAEVAQTEALLSDVETIIRSRILDLDAQVVEGAPPAATVVMVESNAVVRKLRNPDGKVQERIDDYSYGYAQDAARSDLYLTDDEWALLDPGSPDGAWTIDTTAAASAWRAGAPPDPWVPIAHAGWYRP